MSTPERGSARSPDVVCPDGADAAASATASVVARLLGPLSELEGLLEQASAGFSLLDLDGRYVSANQAYAGMLGYTPAELIGRSWRCTVHPDDMPRAEAAYARMLQASAADFEARALRRDGSTFHKHVVMVKAHDGHGRHVGHHCLMEDITERFRNLIEGSIQGILIERYRKPLFVNRAFATLLGYDSPAEVLALATLEAHVAPHERERLARYADARFRGESAPVHYEYDAVRKDGSIITLANVVRVVSWEGEPAIQNTVIDITERKHAERMLRAVIDAVPAIINAKDEHSRYVFMNRYQAELYGVKAEDAAGRTAAELLGADYGAYTQELDRRVLNTGAVIPYFEERYRDAHGVLRTFLTTKVPLDIGGRVRHVATISLDITQRRQVQEALQASEARYHALYDDNPSMFFTLDAGGLICSANRFGAEQLGYTVDELVGRS